MSGINFHLIPQFRNWRGAMNGVRVRPQACTQSWTGQGLDAEGGNPENQDGHHIMDWL